MADGIGLFVIGESEIAGDDYLDLVTSEHRTQPDFIASLSVALQPFRDQLLNLTGLSALFDLDTAVGVQLDAVGRWINRDRFAPGELGDAAYRVLLKASVVSHHWDGSIPGAYEAWDALFSGSGITILIIDHEDMTMELALVGVVPDADTIALLTGGYLSLKPAGVRITGYYYPTIPGPLFGFDIDTAYVAGFDEGGWAEFVAA